MDTSTGMGTEEGVAAKGAWTVALSGTNTEVLLGSGSGSGLVGTVMERCMYVCMH